jgi:hypothetical protein
VARAKCPEGRGGIKPLPERGIPAQREIFWLGKVLTKIQPVLGLGSGTKSPAQSQCRADTWACPNGDEKGLEVKGHESDFCHISCT